MYVCMYAEASQVGIWVYTAFNCGYEMDEQMEMGDGMGMGRMMKNDGWCSGFGSPPDESRRVYY